MGQWHTVKISRTARLAVMKVLLRQVSSQSNGKTVLLTSSYLQIDQLAEVMTISPNGFWHLSLPHSLFLGGVQNVQVLPDNLREKGAFVGCIQKVCQLIMYFFFIKKKLIF